MVEATVNTEEWALRLNKELTEARTRIAALEELLAEKVKVKPLAWRDGKFEAPCIFGLYVVVMHANRFRASLCHTLADGTQSNDVFDEFDYSEDALPRIQADYERRILSALAATPPALLPDGSIAARIFEAGNQIHNIATEHQNNEGLLNRLATLRGEMWSIAREATPPAPKVTGAKAWPEGFFTLHGDARLRDCATEGCSQHVSIRIERGGIGSDYCEPCASSIEALTAAQESEQ